MKKSAVRHENIGLASLLGGEEPVRHFRVPIPDDSVFYLYGDIGEQQDYVDMIHEIRYADPGKIINIHINSSGGCLSSALAIINSIRSCQGQVVTIIDGEACSAAAMIWLAGHKKILSSEDIFFMLHQVGWGMQGKQAEHEVQIGIINKITKSLIDKLSGNLLTRKEKSDFSKGIDVYLHGSEILKRVGKEVIDPDVE